MYSAYLRGYVWELGDNYNNIQNDAQYEDFIDEFPTLEAYLASLGGRADFGYSVNEFDSSRPGSYFATAALQDAADLFFANANNGKIWVEGMTAAGSFYGSNAKGFDIAGLYYGGQSYDNLIIVPDDFYDELAAGAGGR